MAIGTGAGASPDLFGHLDYYNALNSGFTNEDVLAYVNANFSKLSKGPANQPGGGGLYDQIMTGAQTERSAADQNAQRKAEYEAILSSNQTQLDNVQSRFQSQMTALQNSMAQQQQTYQNNLTEMRNTLTAQQNPQKRESVLGVKGASSGSSNTAKLNRQGMQGSFGRTGLRINSLNI
jgi:hypothetical protein